jgi:hypothetical protein
VLKPVYLYCTECKFQQDQLRPLSKIAVRLMVIFFNNIFRLRLVLTPVSTSGKNSRVPRLMVIRVIKFNIIIKVILAIIIFIRNMVIIVIIIIRVIMVVMIKS